MKATAQNVIIWLFLVFVTAESLNLFFKERARANRMTANMEAADQIVKEFQTRDGHNAAKITAQELTISELRRIRPEIISQLKNLYIPPRAAISYTETASQMKAEVLATVKDTILPARTAKERFDSEFKEADSLISKPQKIKVLEYSDEWISILSGNLDLPPVKVSVLANDSIFTGIYKGDRRRPALWILSRRKLQVSATNKNPYIKIKVIQGGVIKK